jgi:hypothetical protein
MLSDRASALKTFAQARERAAEHISAQAAQLWRAGRRRAALELNFAVRVLRVRALQERAQAAASEASAAHRDSSLQPSKAVQHGPGA